MLGRVITTANYITVTITALNITYSTVQYLPAVLYWYGTFVASYFMCFFCIKAVTFSRIHIVQTQHSVTLVLSQGFTLKSPRFFFAELFNTVNYMHTMTLFVSCRSGIILPQLMLTKSEHNQRHWTEQDLVIFFRSSFCWSAAFF